DPVHVDQEGVERRARVVFRATDERVARQRLAKEGRQLRRLATRAEPGTVVIAAETTETAGCFDASIRPTRGCGRGRARTRQESGELQQSKCYVRSRERASKAEERSGAQGKAERNRLRSLRLPQRVGPRKVTLGAMST